MKRIISLLTLITFFAVSCVPTFEEVGELPDDPGIKEVLVGNENGRLPQDLNARHGSCAIAATASLQSSWRR